MAPSRPVAQWQCLLECRCRPVVPEHQLALRFLRPWPESGARRAVANTATASVHPLRIIGQCVGITGRSSQRRRRVFRDSCDQDVARLLIRETACQDDQHIRPRREHDAPVVVNPGDSCPVLWPTARSGGSPAGMPLRNFCRFRISSSGRGLGRHSLVPGDGQEDGVQTAAVAVLFKSPSRRPCCLPHRAGPASRGTTRAWFGDTSRAQAIDQHVGGQIAADRGSGLAQFAVRRSVPMAL